MGKKLPKSSGFTRETQQDLYSLYNAGAEVSDFIQKVEGNPYHFQFYTEDANGVKLPRQAKKKSEQNRNKAIADIIFENVLSEAVCFDTSKLISC